MYTYIDDLRSSFREESSVAFIFTWTDTVKFVYSEHNLNSIEGFRYTASFTIYKSDANVLLRGKTRFTALSFLTECLSSFHRTLVYCRWLSAFGKEYRGKLFTKKFGHLVFPLKHLIAHQITKKIKRDLWGHGMGRHSEQELYGIAQRDLLAVSEILGQKKFLFGDKPCLADAALFAFIAASAWDLPKSPFDELIETKAQNLHTHAQRMKELYYPDWDEIISRNINLV